ncbi:hypothetical protein B9G55_15200 [Saccharibacillus sp. O16]|nr:hypothetical protein B9G55_15200 [Saccharibacillus sp. O16]
MDKLIPNEQNAYVCAELAVQVGAEYPGAETADQLTDRARGKIYRKLDIPPEDRLGIFFDATAFGRYRSGVVFTDRGLYWRTKWETIFISWEEFVQAPLPQEGYLSDAIRWGERELFTVGLEMERAGMLELLTQIREHSGTAHLPSRGPISLRHRGIEAAEPQLQVDENFLLYLCRRSGYFELKHLNRGHAGLRQQPQHELFKLDQDRLIAFRDAGLRAAGKYGVALSSEGLHIRNPYSFRNGLQESFLSFWRIAELTQIEAEKDQVHVDRIPIYSALHGKELIALLEDLRLYLSSLSGSQVHQAIRIPYSLLDQQPWELDALPPGEQADWLVAERGCLLGIYTESQIRLALHKEQLNAKDAYFWRVDSARWMSAVEAGLRRPANEEF